MLYNSLTYAVFFASVLVAYWSLPWHRARLALLLAASWIFYASWYPVYLILLIAVTALNYGAALAIAATRADRPRLARALLALSVSADLANLGFFKYWNFLTDAGAQIAHALFGTSWYAPTLGVFLPLGISFYTFQKIGYLVDVHRGVAPAIRNPLKMALFGSFFPQLIAGPIVRPNEFIPQLASLRRFEPDRFLHGLDLIALGLFKKVLIADQLAPFADQVFAAPAGLGAATLWLGLYAYSVQIYCDFSGYTDIGRGCAYCLGYELPRNFRAPYLALNPTEFWRRWHITLSNWLRDYLYIPLGGNRRGVVRTYMNLLLTMTLGGLWHGASWNFVIWGTLHGTALAATRFVHEWLGVAPTTPLRPGRVYRVFSTLATFHFVTLAWVFFRAPTLSAAWTILGGLVSGVAFAPEDFELFSRLSLVLVALTLAAAALAQLGGTLAMHRRLQRGTLWAASRPLLYFAVAALLLLFANRGPQQFIYFQF